MSASRWPEVELREILAEPIRNGYSPVESAEWTGAQMLGLGCLTNRGFEPRQLKNAPRSVSRTHSAILRDGDLLVSRANTRDLVGLVGTYRDVGAPCIYPDLMMKLRVKRNYLPSFLEVLLRHPEVRRRIKAMAQGTSESMVKISGRALGELLVPLVPLAEQQRIVEVLAALVEEERAIEAAVDKLRTVRRGAHLALMSPVDAARTESASWLRVPLNEVVASAEYGISEALVNDPAGLPVLRMNNLQDGRVAVDDLRYCPSRVPERLLLRRGDVLFNRTNSIDHVGKSAIWRDELPEATFASYLVRLHPDRDRLLPEYLVEWLQHPSIRQRVRAISTVAVQQVNVNPTRLRELEIDFPVDVDEQQRITSALAGFDERIGREVAELAKLRKLKQGLTDDLLSGKVRVKDAA